MAHQQENVKSLHSRVSDSLHEKPMTYAVDESEESTIEAMFDQLRMVEDDLRVVQEHLGRLKREVAKAKS